jgi:hypothetical protein
MSEALDRLVALKEQCRGADESADDHAAHAADLEAAYLAFQQEAGSAPVDPAPGDQPGEYPLTADVQVAAEQTAG